MAETQQGRRLTEAHRVAQLELAGQAIVGAAAVWDTLKPNDIDGTREDWLALELALVGYYDRESADLAGEYLTQYRQVEGAPGPIVDLDAFDAGTAARSLDGYGPGAILHRVARQGVAVVDAKDASLLNFQGAVQRQVLQGGRRVIDRSALANPRSRGWRRVTDGDPCAFCALVASRGPVYQSEATARGGRRYHIACGCTVEEVIGDWRPTEAERRYDDAYGAAAQKAQAETGKRTEAAVLAAMREAGYR